jgi:hypothetical protein
MPRALLILVYSLVFLAVNSAVAAGQTPTYAQFPLPLNPEAGNSYQIRIAPCYWNGVQRPRDASLLANAHAAAELWENWIPGVSVTTGPWLRLPDIQSDPTWDPRWARRVAESCLNAHRGGVGERETVLVMLHPALDIKGYRPEGWSVAGTVQSRGGEPGVLRDGSGAIAHEIGHGLSLSHSAGWAWGPDGPLPGIPPATLLRDGTLSTNAGINPNSPWDYEDAGDLMSRNVSRLNPYNRERLGLTAIGSVYDYWSRNSSGRFTLCDDRGNTDIARVPLDRRDPNKYLLLEYRAERDGSGRIQADGKLNIYLVEYRTSYGDDWGTTGPERIGTPPERRSILLRHQNGVNAVTQRPGSQNGDVYYHLTDPVQRAQIDRGGGFSVTVRRVGNVQNPKPDAQCAEVQAFGVPSDLTPETCAEGFVWREATPADKVCVTRSRQREVARANRSGSRLLTCPSGQVHREAVAARPGDGGDRLCVSPAERNLVREENAAAYSRTFRAQASGPWSCKEGFVWRRANNYDRVCVAPEAAEAIARQNRQNPLSPCTTRFRARGAWPGDSRCVTAAEADVVAAQNADATNNWRWGGL